MPPRIAIVAHSLDPLSRLALSPWRDASVLAHTLNQLAAFTDLPVVVASDVAEVCDVGSQKGVRIVPLPKNCATELWLRPGTLHALSAVRQDATETVCVLSPTMPLLDNAFAAQMTSCLDRRWDLQITVSPTRDHPCQAAESVVLRATHVLMPGQVRDDCFCSDAFAFDWTRCPSEESHPPGMDRLSAGSARIRLPPGAHRWRDDRDRAYDTIAVSCVADGPWLVADPSGKHLLALPGATRNGVVVKAATQTDSSFFANGISVRADTTRWLVGADGRVPAIAFPAPPPDELLIVMQVEPTATGASTVALPWDRAGLWHTDDNNTPLSANGSPILGRQQFPDLVAFDGRATIFARGFCPARESDIDPSRIGQLRAPTPVPIRHVVDLVAAETQNE